MSDYWLIFVPKDPDWVPNGESVTDGACQVLSDAFPVSDGVEAQVFEHYTFVWNGGNFEGVFCPFCGKPADEWWADALPNFENAITFKTLDITTPCCSKQTNLNNLNYPEQVAFARFELSVMNPQLEGYRKIPSGLIEELEATLGTCLGTVWRLL